MLLASVISHIALGAVLALFFVLYYVNGDGKWKIYIELLLGLGGNTACILVLDNVYKLDNITIRMFSIASCIFSFLLTTSFLLIIIAFLMKDKEDKDLLRIRDILLGKRGWIDSYYKNKKKQIDSKLPELEEREKEIVRRGQLLSCKQKCIEEEMNKLEKMGNKKLKILLPENKNIILTSEYIELMPSYFKDVINCIEEMNFYKSKLSENETIDLITFKAYLVSITTSISSNLFNSNSTDIRIHFRYFINNGYEKLIAISGKKVLDGKMTFIPYNEDNMIIRSYECKSALIKSINYEHDYKSDNYKVWKDYMTYTFNNIVLYDKPILSFGISVKNEVRYKKLFYFINFIKFEEYLQDNMELINNKFNIEKILYGGL